MPKQPAVPGDRPGSRERSATFDLDEISVWDLAQTLVQRRRFIGTITAAGALLGVVAALLLPPRYMAETKIVPTDLLASSTPAAGFSPLRAAASQLGYSALGGSGSSLSFLVPQLLSSRDFLLKLLPKQYPVKDGRPVYVAEFLGMTSQEPERRKERAVSALQRMVRSTYDPKSGVTRITVTAGDPVFAAALANAAVEELDTFSRELKSSHAGETVAFVSRRLADVQGELTRAENELTAFRQCNRQIAGSPELQQEEGRRVRDVTTTEQLFITLKTQLEVARIEEARTVSDIAVLERASPPAFRSSPRRRQIVALWACLSGGFSVLVVLGRRYITSSR